MLSTVEDGLGLETGREMELYSCCASRCELAAATARPIGGSHWQRARSWRWMRGAPRKDQTRARNKHLKEKMARITSDTQSAMKFELRRPRVNAILFPFYEVVIAPREFLGCLQGGATDSGCAGQKPVLDAVPLKILDKRFIPRYAD